MLFRQGWRWEECGSQIALSGEGLVATMTGEGYTCQLVTGGSPMTEGRHYWEVELTVGYDIMVGAVRPGLDHDKYHHGTNSLAQLKDACRAKGLPVGGTTAVLRARLEAAAPPPQ
jgi:hypothetical protein